MTSYLMSYYFLDVHRVVSVTNNEANFRQGLLQRNRLIIKISSRSLSALQNNTIAPDELLIAFLSLGKKLMKYSLSTSCLSKNIQYMV